MPQRLRLPPLLTMWLAIAGTIIGLWLTLAIVRCLWFMDACTLFSPRFFAGSVEFLAIWTGIALFLWICGARRARHERDEILQMVRAILDGRARQRPKPDDPDTP